MHVACIQGRADVVQLLITYAEEKLLKQSLKDILNARNKASDCDLFQAHIIISLCNTFITGQMDSTDVCSKIWSH